YFCNLSYLLWKTPFPTIVRLLLFTGVEIYWNISPQTVYSSIALFSLHLVILWGPLIAPPKYSYESEKSQAKTGLSLQAWKSLSLLERRLRESKETNKGRGTCPVQRGVFILVWHGRSALQQIIFCVHH
ncbi:hypothetical protein Tco_1424585, partial [Tanacetum coccineum]